MDNNRNEYFKKYNQEKRVRLSLNLSKDTENDIIEAIERENKENKQDGIKKLIRKGIRYEEQLKTRQRELNKLR